MSPGAAPPARPHAGSPGQAAIELLALLPLVVVATLAAAAILAGLSARERAADAARAGAMALLQGDDATAAARAALEPGDRGAVRVRGGRVSVTASPRLPLGLRLRGLDASVTADAGPEARP